MQNVKDTEVDFKFKDLITVVRQWASGPRVKSRNKESIAAKEKTYIEIL